MKKPILLTTLLFLGIFSAHSLLAQQAMLCRNVLGSAGGDAFVGNKNFEYTLGEPVIETIGNGDKLFTQGFHQPEICPLLVGTSELAVAAGVSVFPNPTAHELHLIFTDPTGKTFQLQVFNALGQLVVSLPKTDDTQASVIDCQSMPPGNYFLVAHTSTGELFFQVPFVKADR